MSLKNVFIGKSGEGIEELYVNLLSNSCYSVCWAKDCLDLKVIAVDNESDYKRALIIGNLLALRNSYDVKWIDINGIVNKINDFCVCKVYVDETCELFEDHKYDLINFTSQVTKKLNLPLLYTNYDQENLIYYIRINLFEDSDEVTLDNCVEYSKKVFEAINNNIDGCLEITSYKTVDPLYESIYLIKTLDFDGSEILSKKESETMKFINLSDFADRTINFYDDCSYFFGYDKLSNKKSYCSDFFWNGIREETTTNCVSSDYSLKVNCNMYNKTEDLVFKCEDIFCIKSHVKVLSDKKLKVISDTNVIRKILKPNNNNNEFMVQEEFIYGKILKELAYNKDSEVSFIAEDYYEIISPNILIHYTNSHKFYETYKIPVGFEFSNGLHVLSSPIVYNVGSKNWINYEDISEVIEALTK